MMTRFEVEPEYRVALRAAGLDDFDAMMSRAGDGPPASRHRHRETVPIVLPGAGGPLRLFLKRAFRVPHKHVREDWGRLRAPRAQPWREWEVIGRLRSAGLPVMRRAAVGERRRWGLPVSGFVLVEAVPAERTVAAWLCGEKERALLGARGRHGLLRGLGRLMGCMRRAGFVWPDVHPRHVFADPAGPGAEEGWRFWLIDVERVRGAAGAEGEAIADLETLLVRCLPFEPTRFEQLAFWSGFTAGSGTARDASIGAAARLLAGHSRLARVLQPDGMAVANQPLEERDGVWLDACESVALERAGLSTAAGLFGTRDGRSLSKSGLARHRERVRLEVNGSAGPRVWYLKRVERPPAVEQLRRIARGRPGDATAWREWRAIRRVASVGVPTVRCLAVAQEMAGVWERRSALLSDAVSGESLEQWVPRAWAGLPRAQRDAVIRQTAAVVRVMHAAGLFHRDLYLSHLFVTWRADGLPAVSVIDLGRVLERPWRAERWRIKDLAALAYSAPAVVTRTERLRFLREYRPSLGGAGRRSARRLFERAVWDRVARRVRRMRRHDEKHGVSG